jgi:hypothetical protein
MQDQVNAPPAPKRVPWNKASLRGQSHPCGLMHCRKDASLFDHLVGERQ